MNVAVSGLSNGLISATCAILLLSACGGASHNGGDKAIPSESANRGTTVTPLMVAVGERDESKVRALLSGGASADDPVASRSPLILAITTFEPSSAASLKCNASIVRALLDHGADANLADPSVGSMPLNTAIDVGDMECAHMIHDAGGRADMHDRNGRTLAMSATGAMARAGPPEILDLVIGWGIDINERSEDGATALHEAVRISSAVAARSLIERGIDQCIKNAIGQTALDMAVNLGRPNDLVSLLRGASRCKIVD